MIILDMGDAPTNGGDFSAFGTYFATSGDNIAAVEIAGAWSNFILDGSRDEVKCSVNCWLFIENPFDRRLC